MRLAPREVLKATKNDDRLLLRPRGSQDEQRSVPGSASVRHTREFDKRLTSDKSVNLLRSAVCARMTDDQHPSSSEPLQRRVGV